MFWKMIHVFKQLVVPEGEEVQTRNWCGKDKGGGGNITRQGEDSIEKSSSLLLSVASK